MAQSSDETRVTKEDIARLAQRIKEEAKRQISPGRLVPAAAKKGAKAPGVAAVVGLLALVLARAMVGSAKRALAKPRAAQAPRARPGRRLLWAMALGGVAAWWLVSRRRAKESGEK